MGSINEYGSFEIILNDYLKKRNISKNWLAKKASLQRTQLNSYCNNKIKRPDFDVLSRICFSLQCDLSDILRYKRPIESDRGE